jgi:hypothetical protein
MQKRILFILISYCCSLLCFGQFERGTITTQLKFDNLTETRLRTSKGFQNTNFSITPGVGYFINNNWEVGVGFNYNRNRERFNGVAGFYHQQLNAMGVTAYSNYYFGKGKLKPYITLQSGWQHTKGFHENETTGDRTNFNFSRFYIGGGLGVNYAINKKVSLFTEATYLNKSPFYNNNNHLNIAAGIRIFFNPKKK